MMVKPRKEKMVLSNLVMKFERDLSKIEVA